ncbi:hypothetical protein MSPP1_003914 [Malassezia sp. CBS 17886]|nr:hypothetical protein MSPP1_003914 [Malassezia sp. CBS 17886]
MRVASRTRAGPTALVMGMLVTGVCNSILSKWCDMQCVANCAPGSIGERVSYSQPVWQTLQMFAGECLCLVAYLVHALHHRRAARRTGKTTAEADALLVRDAATPTYGTASASAADGAPRAPPAPLPPRHARSAAPTRALLLFIVPATCDICATTLTNTALIMMPVSINQMTRGALVLWVGLFSVLFLHRRFVLYQWVSLLLVMGGVCVVGASSLLVRPALGMDVLVRATGARNAASAMGTLLGLGLVVLAQVAAALQFVWEEKFMAVHDIDPPLAVGIEGVFGALIVLAAMPVLHVFVGSTPEGRGGYFDMRTGWHQLVGTPSVLWASVACALSIAGYNMLGLTVTRTMSATARSTIDTLRTLGICAVSLYLGWEVLQPLSALVQAAGFAMLVYGTFLFNGVVRPPGCLVEREEDAERFNGAGGEDAAAPPSPWGAPAAEL